MLELLIPVTILALYATGYLVSLYSLAVYIDPEEVETLSDDVSESHRTILSKLADDPRAFVQIAVVHKALVLVSATALAVWELSIISEGTTANPAFWYLPGIVVLWLSYVLLVEYLPRRSSRRAINPRMLRHLWLVAVIYVVSMPVVLLYRRALKRTANDTPVSEEEKEEIVERAIETLADEAGIGEAIVEDEEKAMIGQIFLLDQTVVREIMIPRIDITAIDSRMTFAEIRALVHKDGHSRYPVYDGAIDKIIGLIYVKDLFNRMPQPGEKFDVDKYLRQPYFVPESKIIGELLQEFKSKRMHIAVVLDDYGGVAGLVTLEDIIEEIFGEIQDEHDAEEAEFQRLSEGVFRVNAGLLVETLQEHLDTDYEQGDYDTVGGLIYDLVGSVPREGQTIRWHDLDLVVDCLEGQRIKTVRVIRR